MGSSQKSSGSSSIASQNPVTALLGQAFGIGTGTRKGGISFKGQIPQLTDTLFGPDTFAGLGDIFEPTDSGARFDLPELRDASLSGLNTLTEAADTGLIDDATALSQQLFGDFTADTVERFGSEFGLNPGDSDLGAILAREAQRSSTELGNLAQDRRLGAATALPSAVGATGSLESLFEDLERQRDPAQQMLNQLMQIAGLSTQGSGNVSNESGRRIGVVK